jgi:hypothetical membrane protein
MSETASEINLRKLWWVWPLTVLASILGVLVVRVLAVALLHPDPMPIALGWGAPIMFTLVLVSGAVLVFALVGRFAKHPLRTYQIVSFIVLLLSFIPDILYASSPMPGASWPTAIALMVMHVVAWAITVGMLTRLTAAKPKRIGKLYCLQVCKEKAHDPML